MSMVEILRSAMRGVLSNKLRSILTMLGVMIGVASVILLLAVGNGSAQQVNAAITQLGTNTLTVRPTSTGGGGASTTGTSTSSSQKVITRDVATELASAGLGHVAQVIPQVSTSLTVASSTISETSINVVGTTPQYFTDTTAKIGSGAAFTAADVTSAAKVAVIGQTIATALFPGQSPIGQTISVSGTTFTVTGVLAQQSSTGFQDPNSVVVAPISRVQQSFTGFGAVSTLTVAATNSSSVSAAQGEIEIELNQLLGITDPTTETYTITNQS
ncbi:MAG: putative transport system permease protein, partial [Microbacteriaceae bacterium]|nr:putative transport system permease protein [Microbacteriaceae bacterium]